MHKLVKKSIKTFYRLGYLTHLSKEEILNILSYEIDKKKHKYHLFSSWNKHKYEGVIKDNCFYISRIVNSSRLRLSLPIIEGYIEEKDNETEIIVDMKLSVDGKFSLAIIIGFVFLIIIVLIIVAVNSFFAMDFVSGIIQSLFVICSPFVTLLFIKLALSFFASECENSKRDLKKLFSAKIIDEKKYFKL
ncbi:MAG: hypothetical protein LBR52_03095 [Prevotellaceae bacterium]|jgi:hypothetical protein|nr:hypothetical protein [Prevotellaceae bacterium]